MSTRTSGRILITNAIVVAASASRQRMPSALSKCIIKDLRSYNLPWSLRSHDHHDGKFYGIIIIVPYKGWRVYGIRVVALSATSFFTDRQGTQEKI